MQFSFTDEQEDFRGILRRFFTARSPSTEVRKLMATDAGWDRDGWKKLNQEMGLAGVHVPEVYGGQGFGCVELAIVLEEMGRALLCAPYFASTVLATTAILNAGTEAQKEALLPDIVTGDVVATLAFAEDNGRWDADGVTMTAYIWLVWIKGAEPRAPFWIPPGCREALTKPDDAKRFGKIAIAGEAA